MQDFIRTHAKKIIAIMGTAFVGIIIFSLLYTFVIFHITSITPSGDKLSYMQPRISITFNKILTDDVEVTMDNINTRTEVKDKTLTVYFDRYMEIGETYSLVLKRVSSNSGDVIKNHKITFVTSSEIPLSEEDDALVLDKQANKNGFYNDPIYKYIPHSTLDYTIDAIGGTDEGRATIEITINLSNADVRTNRDGAINAYKQAALDYLNTLSDIDISSYQITTKVIDPIL